MTDLARNIAGLSPERRKLLEKLLQKQGVDLGTSLIVPQPRDGGPLPLSFAQQRLWFLDQLEPGSAFYNIPTAVRLSGRLDRAALQRSLDSVAQRHETLRTTFANHAGQPAQIIAPPEQARIPLTAIDLTPLPAGAREAEALRIANQDAAQPFDLATGPLVRATLLHMADDEHIVLLTMHHIISDGWSVGVLVGELGTLYEAFVAGQPDPLPPLPIQYADFAAWQRRWLSGATLDKQLDYWKQALAGMPAALELPTDRPRPAVVTPRGAQISHRLPAALTPQLQALARQEGATLFMVLLAAFQTLLHRYSGQDDLCVGTPIANRTRAEIEPLIGFFVNTLVMRARFSDGLTFRQLLAQVRETSVGAFGHQDLPFEMLVEAIQPERDLSRTPLFQVMFILQNTPSRTRRLPGLTMQQVEASSGTATFDLTLALVDQPDGLLASLEYSTDLYGAATIARMLDHLEVLLADAVARPDVPLATLALMMPAERRLIMEAWEHTPRDPAPAPFVHQAFERWAAQTPGAEALVCGDERLSYAELNARANQLARHLRTLGVGPERIVGVCVERSAAAVIVLLGILKAGGAYLPLDPAYPPERLEFILGDARPLVLVRDARTAGTQEERTVGPQEGGIDGLTGGPVVLYLPEIEAQLAALPTENPPALTDPQHLAYVIYTSGSTGTPKGVMITHESIALHTRTIASVHTLTPADCALQFSSLTFDASLEQLLPALTTGGRVVMRGPDLWDPAELRTRIVQHGITWIDLPTAYWHQVAQEWLATGDPPPPTLRLVTPGGEAMRADLGRRWRRSALAGVRLVNTYGPTETTITATAFEPAPGAEDQWHYEPIGRPLPGRSARILDRHLQPVPIGVPGELYLGGEGVARGYLNRPELTAERFVEIEGPLDVGTQESATVLRSYRHHPQRFYRTGDRTRWLPDGSIEFLNRSDFQVKIRGFRVEPGEVEAALAQHPDVREAVVVAREDQPGVKQLVAYVVVGDGELKNRTTVADSSVPVAGGDGGDKDRTTAADSSGPRSDGPSSPRSTISELRAYLKARLPDYMVPAAIVPLAALPMTPSGKIDRRALPAPDVSVITADEHYRAPRTPTEALLAQIWMQLLGIPRVGVHDHFFDLGGHSLLATQLVSRVRLTCQVDLPLRALFEDATLAGLAARVDAERRTAQGLQAPPITPAPRGGRLPLSFAQQRMWFLDRLEPGSPQYNIPDAVRLRGPLDTAALERAINRIVARHEVLRTGFLTVDGTPQLQIHPEIAVPLPVVDLSHLPEQAQDAAVHAHATAVARYSFDLARPPLLHAELLRLGAQDHVALLTIHHIVSDGWSSGILIRELAALYDAFASDQPDPLPELPIQYADYAAWQRSWLEATPDSAGARSPLQIQLDYWKAQLAGLPPLLELPTDRPRPAVQTNRGAHLTFALPAELAGGLQALGRHDGATPFMVLLAAFQALLHRYSGQETIAVGTPIAGRTRAEIEPLIGFFVNTLVLRADFAAGLSFRQLLAQVRERALGAYSHQDVPFEMVVDALQPERNLSHTPLFQVMFILQNTGQSTGVPELRGPSSGLVLGPIEVESGIALFDLTLVLDEHPDGLSGAIEYSTDLFDHTTIARMLAHFKHLLAGIVANPDMPVTQLPLLDNTERRTLLVDWNATSRAYPRDSCVHELFEAQATRDPDAIAARYGSQELSYGALHARANQLAHHLRALGVGPDTLVGLCMERSLDLPVALLGILKAGGAYVPLDPEYPAERLAFMLADAQPAVVVTLGKLSAQLPPHPAHVVALDTDRAHIHAQPTTTPASGVTPEHLAYVIYTSGSTGTPKGVLIPHRAVVNHNLAIVRLFQLTPADRVLQFATISFDTAVEEIFPTWAAGATLVMRPAGPILSSAELNALIEREGITVVNLTTAYWHAWAADLAREGTPVPPSVRFVTAGGDAASAEILAKWETVAGPHVRWLNGYGPTETTVSATFYEPVRGVSTTGYLPIGTGLDNVQVYVLDQHLQPAPIGVPGELFIGGAGVGRGYLNRPELTAERFVAAPVWIGEDHRTAGLQHRWDAGRGGADTGGALSSSTEEPSTVIRSLSLPQRADTGGALSSGTEEPGTVIRSLSPVSPPRLYRTGDRARWLASGVVEFLGRTDQQVKIRGFRIEPGEIEAALAQHPAVREAVVIAREDQPGMKQLVAYVVSGDGGGKDRGTAVGSSVPASHDHSDLPSDGASNLPPTLPSVADLRAYLRTRLPEYMVPTAIVALPALPLTPSGKVDRRALPAPDTVAGDVPHTTVAPRTAAEEALATIWREVLRLPHVGIHDNFFELGGDSILSIQVVARASAAGLNITPRQLFQAPTIAGLAALAGEARTIDAEQGLVTGPAPLTPIQHWFFEQPLPAPHHWNQALLLELRVALALPALERAVATLLEHHDALRLRFRHSDGSWQQEFAPPDGSIPVQLIDLSALPAGEQPAAISAHAAAIQAGLDLAHGPIVRVALFDPGAGRPGRLLLVIHHLAVDGVSWRILLDDLQAAYTQAAAGTASIHLPPKSSAFKAWAERLARYARSAALRDEIEAWEQVAGGWAPRLPLDIYGGENTEESAASVVVALDAAETRALLQDVPPVYRTEINDVLLAALALALQGWTGEPVTAVEIEGHGREELFDDIDLSRTVGWFTTTFPVRLDIGGASDPGAVLKTVKAHLRRIPRRGIGYGLLRYLNRDPDLAWRLNDLVQPEINFNYLGQFDQVLPEGGTFGPARESSGPDHDPRGPRSHALEITGSIAGGCLRMEVTYSTSLHTHATIERLAQEYIQALRNLITHCQNPQAGDLTPSDFELARLTDQQLNRIMSRLNQP